MKVTYTIPNKTTVHELTRYIMAVKEISNRQVAEELKVSQNTVSVFLNPIKNGKEVRKNPMISTVRDYFNAIGETLVVLDPNGKEVIVPDNVLTLNKLKQSVGVLSLKTSLGTFEIDN